MSRYRVWPLSSVTIEPPAAYWNTDLREFVLDWDAIRNEPDPHTAAREMIANVVHSQGKTFKVVNSPIKLSRTPVKVVKASPELGENTEEILTGLLGVSKEEIATLRAEKAI